MDDIHAARPLVLRLRGALLACGVAAVLAAAALTAVALTVYRVRAPVMTMNAIALRDLDASPAAALAGGSPRLTVVVDVSVTNPNAASLRYRGSDTSVYYRARRVGEAAGPAGTARARRTVRLNVTVDVAVGALLRDPGFMGDVAAGAVDVATATRVRGRVAVLGGAVRRRVLLEMNCTATIAVADMSIRSQSCLQRVSW